MVLPAVVEEGLHTAQAGEVVEAGLRAAGHRVPAHPPRGQGPGGGAGLTATPPAVRAKDGGLGQAEFLHRLLLQVPSAEEAFGFAPLGLRGDG